MNDHLRLLWIGFRALRSTEEGCLDRKRVSVTTVRSFDDGVRILSREAADIIVLSLSANGRTLAKQIERSRALSPEALIAVVVCNETDAEYARAVGADDVMSLEGDGELVCAPVLRWVELRRGGDTGLIDLRAATRRRRGLEAEIAHLHTEVSSLTRQVVRDPASGVLGRAAFVLQIELAAELLSRSGQELRLLVFETTSLGGQEDWGDHVLGGLATSIGQTLREVAGDRAVIGRVGAGRFAVALTDASDEDASWLAATLRDQLGEIALPNGGTLGIELCGGRLAATAATRPGQRLLERIEAEIAHDLSKTRVLQRA